MAVSREQWEQVASELKLGMQGLHEWIADLNRHPLHPVHPSLGVRYRDRDGEPLSLGEWAVLFESPSYRVVAAEEMDGIRVVTVWGGVLDVDHRFLFSTGVLTVARKRRESDTLVEECEYDTEVQAIAGHDQLVAKYRNYSS